jgi:hypothetical protein
MIQVQINNTVHNLTNANNIKFNIDELTITVFYDGPKKVIRIDTIEAFENIKFNILSAITEASGVWVATNTSLDEYFNLLNTSLVEVKDNKILIYFQNTEISIPFSTVKWAAIALALDSTDHIKLIDLEYYTYPIYVNEDYVNYFDFDDTNYIAKINVMSGIERDLKMSSEGYTTNKDAIILDLDPAVAGSGSGAE